MIRGGSIADLNKRIAGHFCQGCETLLGGGGFPPPASMHRGVPCSLVCCCSKDPSTLSLPLQVAPSLTGRVASPCPSLYPRFHEVCCGESKPPHLAACLGRRLLLTKLHRLGGRWEEILIKLTTFKKINTCSLNVILLLPH